MQGVYWGLLLTNHTLRAPESSTGQGEKLSCDVRTAATPVESSEAGMALQISLTLDRRLGLYVVVSCWLVMNSGHYQKGTDPWVRQYP